MTLNFLRYYFILINADSFLLKCSRCSWMFSHVYGNECSRTFATEAAIYRYSIKKLFWKIPQNAPDNHIRYGLFFVILQPYSHKTYQNRDFCSVAFLLILRDKSRLFLKKTFGQLFVTVSASVIFVCFRKIKSNTLSINAGKIQPQCQWHNCQKMCQSLFFNKVAGQVCSFI